MNNHTAKIQCIKPDCQNFNLETETFCSRCQTPILKRYLWALTTETLKPGSLIAERYLVKQSQVIIDTKPSETPNIPEEVPDTIIPYLQLSPYRLQVPQVYGLLPTEGSEIWLLEYAYIPISASGHLSHQNLFPPLKAVWHKAKPLRQLSWLWQIAKLWQPLAAKKAASTLLNPELLKVNGPLVQLQELELQQEEATLPQLGDLWASWSSHASSLIREFMKQVASNLQQGKIQNQKELIHILDQALYRWGQQQERSYEILTKTDAGPSRDHNEDACAPTEGNLVTYPPRAIVCDGLGGQEGGEIASKLAISSLSAQLEKLAFEQKPWHPQRNLQELEGIINRVNDEISKRNDQENRRDRQRMGTTLLMALAQAHEMYLSHVGDSRIYLINESGCYQLTVDDDLASREVRLGYALYRDALQYPTSGALIQALGMSSSRNLHPTLQRFILDENCVFLLCSDGLSDFDRVEQYWRTEILPILTEARPLETVAEKLVAIANEKNGHDNVTVALVSCQVTDKKSPPQELKWVDLQESIPTVPDIGTNEPLQSAAPTLPMTSAATVAESASSNKSNFILPISVAVAFALIVGGLVWFLRSPDRGIPTNLPASPSDNPTAESPTLPVNPTPSTEPEPAEPQFLTNPEAFPNVNSQGPKNFPADTYWQVTKIQTGNPKQYSLQACGQTWSITIDEQEITEGKFREVSGARIPATCPGGGIPPSGESSSSNPPNSPGNLPPLQPRIVIKIITSAIKEIEKDQTYCVHDVGKSAQKTVYWLKDTPDSKIKFLTEDDLQTLQYEPVANDGSCPQ